TLGAGLKDLAGNALDQNGNLVPGEGGDAFVGKFSVGPLPPIDLGTPPSGVQPISGVIAADSGLISFLRGPVVPLTPQRMRALGRQGHLPRKVTNPTGLYVQAVTLYNTSGRDILGPIALVVDGLPRGWKLVNASGYVGPRRPYRLGLLHSNPSASP